MNSDLHLINSEESIKCLLHIAMNIHRCIELKFFDCQHSEEQKTISNNSIPVNVHTDFLFRLLKNVAHYEEV